MRNKSTNVASLVVAAQAGDRSALDQLLAAHLPLVYTIVRRAVTSRSDADDVVQETMLRAMRDLPDLRAPRSFRVWLAAIAVHQTSTYLHRRHMAADRTMALEDLTGTPDAEASFEDVTMLQLELSNQRRQVVRASRWLDPDHLALLSLWWLEVAGQLTRTEVADALGVSLAHANVRVQRMRSQLELSRSLVVAMDVSPKCARLEAATVGWDGIPNPLWRKRLARHIRSCPRCSRAIDGRAPTERLLVGFSLLPVPGALISKISVGAAAGGTAVSGAVSGSTGAGIVSQLAQALGAHPAATAVAGAIIAGAVVTAAALPSTPPPERQVIAAPTTAQAAAPPSSAPVPRPTRSPLTSAPARSSKPTPTRTLTVGPASLESVSQTGYFMSTFATYGVLAPVNESSSSELRQRATFEVVAGLADASCFSFRLPDGQYLRHSSWRMRSFTKTSTDTLFDVDATFCVHAGSVPGSISLASYNYPDAFVHRRDTKVWVDDDDGTATFGADTSFFVRAPLQS